MTTKRNQRGGDFFENGVEVIRPLVFFVILSISRKSKAFSPLQFPP
jgi:hypothetical protein